MHPALLISEVVLAIFDALDSATYRDVLTRRQTLSVLARTCHAFCDSALDLLWEDLPDVRYLTKTLPERPVELVADEAAYTPSECSRFFSYAARIRKLEVSWKSQAAYSDLEPLRLVPLDSHHPPLFPRLKSLTWSDDRPGNAIFLRLFLVPSLLHLRIHFLWKTELVSVGCLRDLGTLCPQLQALSLKDSRTSCIPSKFVCSVIRGCHKLEAIRCHGVDEPTMRHLASLPTLKCAEIDIPWPRSLNRGEEPESSVVQRGFENTTYLHLTTARMAHVTSLFAQNPKRPSHVCVDVGEGPESWAIWTFFNTLVSSPSCSNLTHVVLECWDTINNDMVARPTRAWFESITPLLSLRRLEVLSLAVQCSFDLADDDLSRMAQAWPDLEVLVIERYHDDEPPRATLHGLGAFALHCPKTRVIRLMVDALEADATGLEDVSPLPRLSREKLCLSLGNSRINDPEAVARVLTAFFPGTRDVNTWDGRWSYRHQEFAAYKDRWDKVNELLEWGGGPREERVTIHEALIAGDTMDGVIS